MEALDGSTYNFTRVGVWTLGSYLAHELPTFDLRYRAAHNLKRVLSKGGNGSVRNAAWTQAQGIPPPMLEFLFGLLNSPLGSAYSTRLTASHLGGDRWPEPTTFHVHPDLSSPSPRRWCGATSWHPISPSYRPPVYTERKHFERGFANPLPKNWVQPPAYKE